MNTSFRAKLAGSFLLVIMTSLILPAQCSRARLQTLIEEDAQRAAIAQALLLRDFLVSTPRKGGNISGLVSRFSDSQRVRVSVMDNTGRVVAESDARGNIAKMDNHSDRAEIIRAISDGTGSSVRFSNTLQRRFVYGAVRIEPGTAPPPLDKGGIARVAVPFESVYAPVKAVAGHWRMAMVIACVVSLLLLFALSRFLDNPVRQMSGVIKNIVAGKGHHRLHMVPGREFQELAITINDMADRIENSMSRFAAQHAQLEAILEIMEEGILLIGAQGRIRMGNRAFYEQFSIKQEEVRGKLPIEVITSAELQRELNRLLTLPQGQGASVNLQIEPHPDVTFNAHIVRPRRIVQDVLAVMVFHDITELVRLMRVRRDFVANVSHELRTPLTAISTYAETLQESAPDDVKARQEFLDVIRRNAAQMGRMIEDLLVLARLENAGLPLSFADTSLFDCARLAAKDCALQAKSNNVTIEINIAPDLAVRADNYYMTQVFRNLLENACRYTKPDTTVEVWSELAGNFVTVRVRDHGPGIPAAALTRVFERFYKADRHSLRATSSTGLGLAICKHIIERHGGSIRAVNTPGATIEFTIPTGMDIPAPETGSAD
jgi:two-component system phosphate regulon sensor histidine kinase PhoR